MIRNIENNLKQIKLFNIVLLIYIKKKKNSEIRFLEEKIQEIKLNLYKTDEKNQNIKIENIEEAQFNETDYDKIKKLKEESYNKLKKIYSNVIDINEISLSLNDNIINPPKEMEQKIKSQNKELTKLNKKMNLNYLKIFCVFLIFIFIIFLIIFAIIILIANIFIPKFNY
jgi:Fe2+ transport system protein B